MRPTLLVALLVLVVAPSALCLDCNAKLKEYNGFASKLDPAPYKGNSTFLYFMHVPRTAGRAFKQCLLGLGTPPKKRCPRSYDGHKLSAGDCTLLSSHDDLSVLQQLPAGTAVASQLRDPVDRIISAYEFAVEVAARYAGTEGLKTDIDEVWPWSHLVPFFAANIKENWEKIKAEPVDPQGHWVEKVKRVDHRLVREYQNRVLNLTKPELTAEERERLLPPVDPYNHPAYMPLAEFVAHPIAQQLLHNGQMLQVLGATNNSRWSGAQELQQCLQEAPEVASELLQAAKERLKQFAHVGTTEDLNPSFESGSVSLGRPFGMQSYPYEEEQVQPGMESGGGGIFGWLLAKVLQYANPQAKLEILGLELQRCAAVAQQSGLKNRFLALKNLELPDGRGVAVRGRRKLIPAEVIQEIKQRNALDMELHQLASQLLTQRHAEQKAAGDIQLTIGKVNRKVVAKEDTPKEQPQAQKSVEL